MPSTDSTYRSSFRSEYLPTCVLDTAFFKKLYENIDAINQEATKLEITALEKGPDQSDKDFEKLKEYATNLCKLRVLIYGSKGEFLSSESVSVFESSSFPDALNSVIFDNSLDFNFQVKRNPRHSIRIEFDFTKPQVFNLSENPSLPTPNKSSITVQGENEQWVDWAFGKAKSLIEARKTNRGWLHLRYHIYDVLVWFFILPLTLWNLYKIETRYAPSIQTLSKVLQVAIYIYTFVIILYAFRMIFNYSRWVFPYMELSSSIKTGATKHRIILGAILTSLVVALIRDFVKYVIPLLFK